jgi:hypothetical protein
MPKPCQIHLHESGWHCGDCGHPWWEHRQERDFRDWSVKDYVPERHWLADYYYVRFGPCPRCLRRVKAPAIDVLPFNRCKSRYEPCISDPSGWYAQPGSPCSRPRDHTGRHHAIDGERVLAVWVSNRTGWTI